MHPMIRRQQAAQACVDRFAGRSYAPGSRDCVKLAGHAMHKMGRKVSMTKGLRWSSEAGGVKALRKLGFKTLIDAVDALGLPRIAPAAALPGDLVAMPADRDGFGAALTVAVGNGRVIGFFDGIGAVVEPHQFVCAWRV